MIGLRSLALWGVVLTSACVGGDEAVLETTPTATVSPAGSTPIVETEQAGQPDADPFTVETSAEPIQIEWTIDLVSAARARALSDLDGVRATRWPDVIMAMSDGRLWVSKAYGAFESFDPSTGLYRALYRDDFGGRSAQEIPFPVGSLDGAALEWRIDPFTPLSAPSPDAVAAVAETDREGRLSWEITWSDGDNEIGRDIVDMRTGLMVEHHLEGPLVTDVGPIDSLPAEFPGRIPDDVEVNRDMNNPAGQRPATMEQAAAEFTPGLLVPADLPPDTTVFVYDPALGRDDPRREAVTIIDRDGFNTVQVEISKFLPYDYITMTAGDVACYDADQDQVCDYQLQEVGAVDGGALAGRDFTVMDGVVTVYDAGRTINITNVDPQRSLAIANSFIEVSGS